MAVYDLSITDGLLSTTRAVRTGLPIGTARVRSAEDGGTADQEIGFFAERFSLLCKMKRGTRPKQ